MEKRGHRERERETHESANEGALSTTNETAARGEEDEQVKRCTESLYKGIGPEQREKETDREGKGTRDK